jgi:hypothetical protein
MGRDESAAEGAASRIRKPYRVSDGGGREYHV